MSRARSYNAQMAPSRHTELHANKQRLCRFVYTKRGCRNGNKCTFLHDTVQNSQASGSAAAIKAAADKKSAKLAEKQKQDQDRRIAAQEAYEYATYYYHFYPISTASENLDLMVKTVVPLDLDLMVKTAVPLAVLIKGNLMLTLVRSFHEPRLAENMVDLIAGFCFEEPKLSFLGNTGFVLSKSAFLPSPYPELKGPRLSEEPMITALPQVQETRQLLDAGNGCELRDCQVCTRFGLQRKVAFAKYKPTMISDRCSVCMTCDTMSILVYVEATPINNSVAQLLPMRPLSNSSAYASKTSSTHVSKVSISKTTHLIRMCITCVTAHKLSLHNPNLCKGCCGHPGHPGMCCSCLVDKTGGFRWIGDLFPINTSDMTTWLEYTCPSYLKPVESRKNLICYPAMTSYESFAQQFRDVDADRLTVINRIYNSLSGQTLTPSRVSSEPSQLVAEYIALHCGRNQRCLRHGLMYRQRCAECDTITSTWAYDNVGDVVCTANTCCAARFPTAIKPNVVHGCLHCMSVVQF